MHKNRGKTSGFTLLELMVTLAIAAILASLAAPSFSDIIKNNRMTTQYNELLASLSVARSEAIKRGATVTVCKSIDQASCSGNWKDGWIIFVESNTTGGTAGTVDSGEDILRVHAALSGGNTLSFARNRVSYGSDALATGFTGTFILCDDRGDSARKGLLVSNTGRVRQAIASDTLASCP